MLGKQRNNGDRTGAGGVGVSQSGFRSFGRGGGFKRSGRGKASFYASGHPLPLQQRRTDVMLEAGRLAAEYLVGKGVLPANSLPLQTASARSRQWRKRSEEEDSGFERRNWKGRGGTRRYDNGSYSRQGSDWGRENGRGPGTDYWSEKSRYNEDFDRETRSMEGEYLDRQADFDDSSRSLAEASRSTTEISLPSKSESDSDRSMENYEAKMEQPVEVGKNMNINTDLEMVDAEKKKDSVNGVENEAVQPCSTAEAGSNGEVGINLLSFRGFAKVPTKPRSVVPNRSLGLDKEVKETEEELEVKPEEISPLSIQKDSASENSPCSNLPESTTLNDSNEETTMSASLPKISHFADEHQERNQVQQNFQLPTKIDNDLSEEFTSRDKLQMDVVNSIEILEKERQLESSSFKICDLNLMGSSDVTNVPSSSTPDVIDVDDSPVLDIASEAPKNELDPVYPNLENFLNNPVNNIDLPEIQDGYGLNLSEFLGSDMAGCSSIQGDISNLQAEVGFHGAEGIDGIEDSFYVTYGEIPLGFMGVWDQPPPEYGKFF